MKQFTPEQKEKHLKAIEKIESLPRPQKWREVKKFVLSIHPELRAIDKEYMQACKEMRQGLNSDTASSELGTLSLTMKIPTYVYQALIKFDPEIVEEASGRNKGYQYQIMQEMAKAFPEYRVARKI